MLKTLSTAICALASLTAFAQKGLPPSKPTSATVGTNFPAHIDFKESMLSQLKTDKNFTVSIAASGLGKPRMMALGVNNMIYVTRRDVGDVLLLEDPDGDGKYNSIKTVVANFPGVHGIVIKDNMIYLCATKKLTRGPINTDGSIGILDTLIKDLPDGGQHDNRTIAFGPDGKLYLTIGSDCNDCKETNPEHAFN